MADITRRFGYRHLRGTSTTHVRHYRGGELVHEGVGLSFWYRPLPAVLAEVPVDDRELPLLFHARTSDFQDVTVQLTLTYRLADPALAAQRIDFSLDPDTGHWRADPLAQLAGLLTENVQQYALDVLARTPLATALVDGVQAVRDRVRAGLIDDTRLERVGTEVVDVRVVAVQADAEMEKALRTTAREQVQQEADRATYERRALAVERERAIGENELQTRIELARREEQLLAQRGANARREAEDAATADGIQVAALAARERRLAEARAEGARAFGAAEAANEAARLDTYRELAPEVLKAMTLREIAAHLPEIKQLVVTPDLVTDVLARLGLTS